MKLSERILNVLIAIDQLVYVLITLGSGSPDETMSSAAYRMEQKGKMTGKLFRPVIDALFFILARERKHCEASYLAEKLGTQLPEELRRSANGLG